MGPTYFAWRCAVIFMSIPSPRVGIIADLLFHLDIRPESLELHRRFSSEYMHHLRPVSVVIFGSVLKNLRGMGRIQEDSLSFCVYVHGHNCWGVLLRLFIRRTSQLISFVHSSSIATVKSGFGFLIILSQLSSGRLDVFLGLSVMTRGLR